MQVYRRCVHLPSLEGNPLGDPAYRDVVIFLPDPPPPSTASQARSHEERLPVIYFLHGYGQTLDPPTISFARDVRAHNPLLIRLLFGRVFKTLPTFEKLQEDINRRRIPPFILVQPDGSLHRPQTHGRHNLDGSRMEKGNFYSDSPYTGNHGTAIFRDLVAYIDRTFPTRPGRSSRALVGGSMGGYGALLGAILFPDTFGVVAALSPAVCCLDLIGHNLIIPYRRVLAGARVARREGREAVDDILDSCDMVYSRDAPLVPTIRRDADGHISDYDAAAWERWAEWDLTRLIRENPDALRETHVSINCHARDDYGFAEPTHRLHRALTDVGIRHHFEIYTDRLTAALSPHIAGIGRSIKPALLWAAQKTDRQT